MSSLIDRGRNAFRASAPWILGAFIVAMIALSVVGSLNNAIVSDEQHHVGRLKAFLSHGYYVAGYTGGGGIPHFGNMFAYAPMFSLVAHAIAVLFGVETWGTVSETAAGYDLRHIVITVFGAAGAFAAGYAVSLSTRSRTWGLFATATVLALPMWTGSAMYNVKDVPVGAGFTILTAGFVALTLRGTESNRRQNITAWVLIALGTLFTIGVRQGMWPALVLFTVALVIMLLVLHPAAPKRWGSAVRSAGFAISAMGVSYVLLMIIYPAAFGNPWLFLKLSFKTSSDFPHKTLLLTDGVYEKTPVGPGYLPQWIAAKTPDIVLAIALIGLVAAILIIAKRMVTPAFTRFDRELPVVTFAIIQLLAFPLAAIVLHSNVYGGMRQFLFVMPAIALLFTLTLFVVVRSLTESGRQRLSALVVAAAVFGLVLPTIAQVQLFPYNSEYFNITTSARGIDGRWDVDRWHLSAREVLATMPVEYQDRCVQVTNKIKYCTEGRNVSIYAPFTSESTHAPQALSANESVTIRFPDIPKDCRPLDSVTRNVLWVPVLIGQSSACPLHVADYTAKPKNGDGAVSWWASHFAWGWEPATATGIDSVPGRPSQLGFGLPPSLQNRALLVGWSGSFANPTASPLTLIVSVNGTELFRAPLKGTGLTGSVAVPGSLADSLADHSVQIEFQLVDDSGTRADASLHLNNLTLTAR